MIPPPQQAACQREHCASYHVAKKTIHFLYHPKPPIGPTTISKALQSTLMKSSVLASTFSVSTRIPVPYPSR